MLKGHIPRVIYHPSILVYGGKTNAGVVHLALAAPGGEVDDHRRKIVSGPHDPRNQGVA